jgi:hypothetical protein
LLSVADSSSYPSGILENLNTDTGLPNPITGASTTDSDGITTTVFTLLPSSNSIKGTYLFYIQATAEGGSTNTLVQYTLEVICGAASTSISEPGGLSTGA